MGYTSMLSKLSVLNLCVFEPSNHTPYIYMVHIIWRSLNCIRRQLWMEFPMRSFVKIIRLSIHVFLIMIQNVMLIEFGNGERFLIFVVMIKYVQLQVMKHLIRRFYLWEGFFLLESQKTIETAHLFWKKWCQAISGQGYMTSNERHNVYYLIPISGVLWKAMTSIIKQH